MGWIWINNFGSKTWSERSTWETKAQVEINIKPDLKKKKNSDWVEYVDQVGVKRWAFVNIVMNLWF